MQSEPQGMFLDFGQGVLSRRFGVHHAAAGAAPRALIVYVHPFAEEMNKARRMAALQSRALAAAGFAVLQTDLLGCGDSAGDFGDAGWSSWVDDVVHACEWLVQRHRVDDVQGPALPLWIWGLRAGCLLAAEAAARMSRCDGLLLWQPTTLGKQVLRQFLRLKTAGGVFNGQPARSIEHWQQQLSTGHAVDVASYRVSPALAAGLDASTLAAPAVPRRTLWFDIAADDEIALPLATDQTIARWQAAGCAVHLFRIEGPAFWQTAEIEEVPALIEATVSAMNALLAASPAFPTRVAPTVEA